MWKVIPLMNSCFSESFKQERNKAFIRLVFWCRNMKTKVTRPPTQFPIWIQWSSLLNGAYNGRVQWLNQQTVGIKTEFCKQCEKKIVQRPTQRKTTWLLRKQLTTGNSIGGW